MKSNLFHEKYASSDVIVRIHFCLGSTRHSPWFIMRTGVLSCTNLPPTIFIFSHQLLTKSEIAHSYQKHNLKKIKFIYQIHIDNNYSPKNVEYNHKIESLENEQEK